MTRDEVIEATRAFLREEVTKDAAGELPEDLRLLSGGIVTSFDLVALVAFLERRFDVKVPDAMISRDHLDTLDQIAALVLSLRAARAPLPGQSDTGALDAPVATAGAPAPPARPDPLARLFPSFRRWAGLVLLPVLGLHAAADGAVASLDDARVRTFLTPEIGPDRFTIDSPLDFQTAIAGHALARTPRAPDELRVVVLGHSGMMGMNLDEEDAAPRRLEDELRRAGRPTARVYNLSYWLGASFAKDAALLELALPHDPDVVVVTFDSLYVARRVQDFILGVPSPPVLNARHLARFFETLPAGARGRPELMATERAIEATRASWRFALPPERPGLVASAPAVRAAIAEHLAPRWNPRVIRLFRGKTVADVDPIYRQVRLAGGSEQPLELDARAVAMLDAVVARARGAGAEVVLALNPEATLAGSPPRRCPFDEAGWREYEQAVRNVASTHGATVIDARDLLHQDEFTDQPGHWTPRGNAELARALARGLEPALDAAAAGRAARAAGR